MKDFESKTVYKIRNGKGLFSMGGISPTFNKKGKTWTKLAYVKVHLDAFRNIPDDWTVVEYQVVVRETQQDLGLPRAITQKVRAIGS